MSFRRADSRAADLEFGEKMTEPLRSNETKSGLVLVGHHKEDDRPHCVSKATLGEVEAIAS